MKVRWTKQSLRLRITPAELTHLQQSQSLNEVLCVPNGHWSITIKITDGLTRLDGAYGTITLFLAQSDQAKLANPGTEGVYFRSEDANLPLTYYVEKDFPCIHPRSSAAQEPGSETFAALLRP